jgi:hypothetical protein
MAEGEILLRHLAHHRLRRVDARDLATPDGGIRIRQRHPAQLISSEQGQLLGEARLGHGPVLLLHRCQNRPESVTLLS